MDITHDNVCSSMLSCFYSHLLSTGRPISSFFLLHQLTKVHFEPIKEASLKHLTFKTVFLLTLGSGTRRSEIQAWQTEILDTILTGQRCPCTHHPAFSPRISWSKRLPTVWPQGLWIDPSSLTGPSVRSEHCTTIWTGPQAE